MIARKSLAPWEKARGSRVVVRPLQAAPGELDLSGSARKSFEEEEPEQPEPPRIVQRAPGSRPGDRLRRIAAYSSAASMNFRAEPDFRAKPENLPKDLSLTQAKLKKTVVGKPEFKGGVASKSSENARTEGPNAPRYSGERWSLKELLDALADELGPN